MCGFTSGAPCLRMRYEVYVTIKVLPPGITENLCPVASLYFPRSGRSPMKTLNISVIIDSVYSAGSGWV